VEQRVSQEQVAEILWEAFLVQERRPDVENEKAPEICVNKGYREFVLALQDTEEKLPGHLVGIFPFPVDYLYILLSCAKRLSEAGERTTMQRESTLSSYCALQKF
jgi:hypothetical protein